MLKAAERLLYVISYISILIPEMQGVRLEFLNCFQLLQEVLCFRADIVNITLHFFLKDVRSMLPPAVNHSIAVS